MDKRRALAVLLVVALLAGLGTAALVTYDVPVEGDIPVTTDQTPLITLGFDAQEDVTLNEYYEGDQLNITTADGDIIVSGDDGAHAYIHTSNIEGSQTQLTQIDAGTNWLELNPADKNRVDVRGDVDTFAFSQIGVNDGSTDIQLSGTTGGFAEVRLHGLEASTEYVFYDASGDQVLGSLETDTTGTGAGSVDMPDGTHALEIRTADTFDAPVLSNPVPEGQVSERPSTLSVDVEADAYPVDVEITLEGEVVHTETVSEPTTVTADVNIDSLGAYQWGATATDELGQTDTLSTSFETPDTLTLREEHEPGTVIENANVTLRFFTVGGDIAIEREVENGTLDMEGLPISEFVVFADSDEHYDRTIYIDSIFEQENMFLLNETAVPRDSNDAVRSRFIYEDLTGSYPTTDTTLQVQRALDLDGDGTSEWRTVAGDYWGASNEYEAILERGARYRLVLVNQQTGEETIAGTHIPTESLSQTVRVSGLREEAENASGIVGLAELVDGEQIDILYDDPSGETTDLRIIVERRSGDEVIYDETIDGPLGSYSETIALNETQQEHDWIVRFESENHHSAIPVGDGTVGLPTSVPSWLLTFLASMAVTFIGALYGPRTAILGAWAMVFVAAGISMFGWAFSPVSVLVAALVAVGVTLVGRSLP